MTTMKNPPEPIQMPTPENPHVGVVTAEEIAQLIANDEAKNKLGVDPATHDIQFKVTYRNLNQEGGGKRLVAPISIYRITPKPPPIPEKEPTK